MKSYGDFEDAYRDCMKGASHGPMVKKEDKNDDKSYLEDEIKFQAWYNAQKDDLVAATHEPYQYFFSMRYNNQMLTATGLIMTSYCMPNPILNLSSRAPILHSRPSRHWQTRFEQSRPKPLNSRHNARAF